MIKLLGIYAPAVASFMLALSSGLGLLAYRHAHVLEIVARCLIFSGSLMIGGIIFMRIRKQRRLGVGPYA
jgi:hypothetical protein